jgi:Protein of unknown function (DUF1579)
MTKPTAKHLALSVFAGNWITQGTIRATKDAAASEMRAIDRYEWLPGGFFMLHTVDALIGGSVSQSIEVIGYDSEHACYVTRSYDDQGTSDDFTARLNGQAWSIDGEKVRFRGAFNADGAVLTGTWEQRSGQARWREWMDIALRKVTSVNSDPTAQPDPFMSIPIRRSA